MARRWGTIPDLTARAEPSAVNWNQGLSRTSVKPILISVTILLLSHDRLTFSKSTAFSRLLVDRWHQVAVAVQRGLDRGMAEVGLDV